MCIVDFAPFSVSSIILLEKPEEACESCQSLQITCKVLQNVTGIAIILFQTLMSVASIPTTVLTVAPIPLGPTHVAVIQDTVWLPTDARVKVWYIDFHMTD